ncbi:MAG: hypothetical protein ACOYNI_07525 [Acidimicrobiia bacterium]
MSDPVRTTYVRPARTTMLRPVHPARPTAPTNTRTDDEYRVLLASYLGVLHIMYPDHPDAAAQRAAARH